MNNILEVSNLTKTYGRKSPFTAVNHISFALEEGEILGLLGPNGAGKSTTIQMLLGVLTPSEGEIRYFSRSFDSERSEILSHIGYVNGYSKLPWNLSVDENLDVFGRLAGLTKETRIARSLKLLEFFDCLKLRKKLMGTLSAGEATRVMLVKAFLHHPRIVLLDEPTAALDPDICAEVRAFVKLQREKHKVSMIYTSHNMSEVAEICDRVVFMKDGRISAVDTPARLAATITLSVLRVRVIHGIEEACRILHAMKAAPSREGSWLELSLESSKVGATLQELTVKGIELNDIEIVKPTLEDYFLKAASG